MNGAAVCPYDLERQGAGGIVAHSAMSLVFNRRVLTTARP
jgi:hypothetical protein